MPRRASFPQFRLLTLRLCGDSNVRGALDVQKTAERMLLAQYAPASVIVDDALNVVHVRGDTGPYLQVASGEPTYSLLKMARAKAWLWPCGRPC